MSSPRIFPGDVTVWFPDLIIDFHAYSLTWYLNHSTSLICSNYITERIKRPRNTLLVHCRKLQLLPLTVCHSFHSIQSEHSKSISSLPSGRLFMCFLYLSTALLEYLSSSAGLMKNCSIILPFSISVNSLPPLINSINSSESSFLNSFLQH